MSILLVKFHDMPEKLGTRKMIIEMITGKGSRVVIDEKTNRCVVDAEGLDPEKVKAIRRQLKSWSAEITVK